VQVIWCDERIASASEEPVMETVTIAASLDKRGKTITTFVVFDVAAALATMPEGQVVEVLTDDFEPFESDIGAWCDAVGHHLVASEATSDGHRFLIEKGKTTPKDTSLAVVVSTDVLVELLSPLGFALAAGLEGTDVHLFVQGPGVRVLSRGYQPKLRGWARPFSRFARAGLAKTGHIPAQDKLRQLLDLGATISMCGPSMERFKVDKDDVVFADLPIVEYLSFMPVMERADVTIYA
jgi:predicted peroxiredoxin/TusA-related sulfurtransferase